jgi:hypothetical protein
MAVAITCDYFSNSPHQIGAPLDMDFRKQEFNGRRRREADF